MCRPLALAALASILFSSCKRDDGGSKRFRPTPPNNDYRKRDEVYPFERRLVDEAGRKLDVVVVGRSKTKVVFQKRDSPKRIHYPLDSLSEEDRVFLGSLPIKEWDGDGQKGADVGWLEQERLRLEGKIAELKKERERTPDAATRTRALNRKITELENERREILTELRGRGRR